MAGIVRIGISGWRYAPWRGVFYPKALRQADELKFATRQFNSIEINGSFYSLQSPASYTAWRDTAPDDFEFAVKASRYITHLKRLRDITVPSANFWASGILCLAEKLGPILWQFPPSFSFDDRFGPFLAALPRTLHQASRLARNHDARVLSPSFAVQTDRALRHAVEIRHKSFCTPEFIALLRAYEVALVTADTAKRFPFIEDITADFSYIRLHGDKKIYISGYSPKAIQHWAKRVQAIRGGRKVRDAVRVSPVAPPQRATRFTSTMI